MKSQEHLSKYYKAGETVFTEDSPANSLFLIKMGRVSIRKATEKGVIEIAQIGANQIFGELAFFDRKARSAEAVAAIPSEIVEVPFDVMERIFEPTPPYLKKIMGSLAERLRDADEKIRELKERLGDSDTSGYVNEVGTGEAISDLEMALILTADPAKK